MRQGQRCPRLQTKIDPHLNQEIRVREIAREKGKRRGKEREKLGHRF